MEEEFKDIAEDENKNFQSSENSPETQKSFSRVRLPKKGEVIGIIEQRLGGNKILVNCTDGKIRNCRVPGRMKRKLWLRTNDVVIVEPWELDPEKKGDVIFQYRPNQISWLKKNGYLKTNDSMF